MEAGFNHQPLPDAPGVAVLENKVARTLLKCFHCASTTRSKRKLRQHVRNKHVHSDAKKDMNSGKSLDISCQLSSECTLLTTSRSRVNNSSHTGETADISSAARGGNFDSPPSSSADAAVISEAAVRNATSSGASPTSDSPPAAQSSAACKPRVGKNQHHCTYCGYLAVSAGKLAVHVRTHTGEKPFACTYCDYTCSNTSGLNAHTRKYHTGENLHSCPHCPYKSLRPGHLERHIRKHTGEKPFGCTVCEASFTCMDYLNDHVRDFHNKERLFACPYCDKKLSRPGYFEAHLRTHTKKTDIVLIDSTDIPQKSINTLLNSFECHIDTPDSTISGEKTAGHPESTGAQLAPSESVSATANAVKSADGDAVFSCTLCDFKCSASADLRVHIKTHKTVKPYKCPICPYSCKLPDTLHAHVAIHTGDKPFRCPHCDARFTLQSRLNQHVVIHDDGKRQKCPECDYVCYRNTDMRKHMPKHTGERNYVCPACLKNFVSNSSVRSHMRHVHNLDVSAFKINSLLSLCDQDRMDQAQSTSCPP